MHKKQKILLVAVGGVILLVIIIAANITTLKKQLSNLSFFRAPTPTPFKYSHYVIPAALPSGKQVYNVSRGSGSSGPDIRQVIIDNFDPKKGEQQTISVKVQNSTAVNKVNVTVATDYEVKTYDAALKTGTVTDGIWEAVAASNDTHDYVYRIVAEAADAKDKSAVTLTIR